MNTRSNRKLVTFGQPFQLTGMDQIQPPGTYEVTTEEREIGDFVFDAYRRLSTTIYLPPRPGDYGVGRIISIDPVELSDALAKSSVKGGRSALSANRAYGA